MSKSFLRNSHFSYILEVGTITLTALDSTKTSVAKSVIYFRARRFLKAEGNGRQKQRSGDTATKLLGLMKHKYKEYFM